MQSRKLIKLIEAEGWTRVRVNGDHHQFKHPDYSYLITVTHPVKDLPKGLVHRILKQANLK